MRLLQLGVVGTALVASVGACSRLSVGDLGSSGGSASAGADTEEETGGRSGGHGSGGASGAAVQGGTTSTAGRGTGRGGAAGSPEQLDCAANLRQLATPPEVDCPDAKPTSGEPCDVTENGICVWQTGVQFEVSPGYIAMGCYATATGKRWYAMDQGFTGTVGVNNDQCPRTEVTPDSSCAGHAGQYCYYPLENCSCAADDATWSCTPNELSSSPPREVVRLCPPSGVDEAKALSELSEQERRAWCNWYGDPTGNPRPALRDDMPQNTSQQYNISFSPPAGACMPELPVELCMQNLRVRSACPATVKDLDDCVETVRGYGQFWVGHGCSVLFSDPDCERLIAAPSDGSPVCDIPLE